MFCIGHGCLIHADRGPRSVSPSGLGTLIRTQPLPSRQIISTPTRQPHPSSGEPRTLRQRPSTKIAQQIHQDKPHRNETSTAIDASEPHNCGTPNSRRSYPYPSGHTQDTVKQISSNTSTGYRNNMTSYTFFMGESGVGGAGK